MKDVKVKIIKDCFIVGLKKGDVYNVIIGNDIKTYEPKTPYYLSRSFIVLKTNTAVICNANNSILHAYSGVWADGSIAEDELDELDERPTLLLELAPLINNGYASYMNTGDIGMSKFNERLMHHNHRNFIDGKS